MAAHPVKPIHFKPWRLLLVFTLIMLIVGLANYAIMVHSQTRLIEHDAIRIAEVATSQAVTSRSVYTTSVADELMQDAAGPQFSGGLVPLPAQFLKLVAHEVSKDTHGLYRYAPLSKWNLEPDQGLKDGFQQWAWAQLEQQDQAAPGKPIDWRPIWRFEEINGVRTLRYMRADAASSTSCVSCHNALELTQPIIARRIAAGVAPGRQWKQHQLLGAIEANIPVDKIEAIAATQARSTLVVGLFTTLSGLVIAACLALRDVHEARGAAAHFEEEAMLDPLTRLGNRKLFVERANLALGNAARDGTQVGVLFIDLDHFKQINDTFGHQIGDRVLSEVGRRLMQCLRECDFVARQGGDEFLVLLLGGSQHANFLSVAQKLLDALEPRIDVDGESIMLAASIGISHYPEQAGDVATLIEKADTAMYHAKRQGRKACVLWNEGMAHPARREEG